MSRVLVRATNWLGDAVMSLPAIRELRRVFPHAHLAVVARPSVADLYARERAIDRVIPYPPGIDIRPGGAYGNATRRLPERFAEAGARLNLAAVVFGSASERALWEEVGTALRSAGRDVRNGAGETTLREFIDLAAACSLFLT